MDEANTLYNMSLDCLGDRGHPVDCEKAFALNSQAAALGLPDAILSMGWFHFNGFGARRDLHEAARWYRRSARLGEPRAMFNLGAIACEEKRFETAIQWFERASAHGHVRSLYWLGKLHWRGQGVPADQKRARALFERAARANDPEAKRLMRFLNRRRYAKR